MDRVSSNPLPLETAVLLSQVSALLSRAGGRRLGDRRVTWPQALSLVVLAARDTPISATRLVEQLGLGRTAMTSVVDRLERNGWVQRRPSPVDRRTADLVLTEAGRALVDEIRTVLDDLARASFAAFKPRELEHLAADLTRLRSDLTAKMK